MDWWDWWFRGSRTWRHRRQLIGGLLIIALLGIIAFITLIPLVGTFMPSGNVPYEHKNDTTFSYQRTSIKNLFDIDAKFEKDLNNSINSNISANLTKIFKTKGFPISKSENATVRKEKDDDWVITDGEKIYIVEKEDGKLIVYKGSIEEIEKKNTQTFSNATTPRTGTIPSSSIWTLIGLAVFIFIILIFPQLKKGTVSIGEFKFEVETKDAGTSDIAK